MNPKYIFLSLVTILIGFNFSCNRMKKTAAEEEREKWLLSLNDSIASYKSKIESDGKELDVIRTDIGSMIVNFDHVSNPKLVEGYYIYKGWNTRFPPVQTGITARITQNEGFELIAASTSATFDQIKVNAGGEEAISDVVPHDQALNYRAGSLNRVCFYGNAADSIGILIASHLPDTITLTFINGGKSSNYTIPADQKEMIAATWQLYSSQREAHRLESEIPRLSRQVDACRRMLEANDSIFNK